MLAHRTRRSPWWLAWAAILGVLAGLFVALFAPIDWPLASLVGLVFGIICWGALHERGDYRGVEAPVEYAVEVTPLARVRAGTEEDDER